MRSAYINRGVRSASPPAPLPLLSSASLDFSMNLDIFRDAFKSFKSIGLLSPPQRNEGSSWLWVRGKVKGMLGYPRAASVIEEFELKIQ
ncbi:hypothetical protein DPX16_5513 [Anabarilius grahami]|uniref:Uncharacterized protein n=1 Tax=Anabarilius grahami TaxID=495550 RepID=A0A3N0Z3W0_ANAGA|nr:hypothetical protein DPX16_5513 [Anabarilius grahami]